MFWKNKKQNNGISALEKRICDLESPFKFEIGDEVRIEWVDKEVFVDGKIVDIRIRYANKFYNHTDSWLITSFNLSNLYEDGKYIRSNEYFIYVEELNISDWRYEAELKLKAKKK